MGTRLDERGGTVAPGRRFRNFRELAEYMKNASETGWAKEDKPVKAMK